MTDLLDGSLLSAILARALRWILPRTNHHLPHSARFRVKGSGLNPQSSTLNPEP